MSNLAPGVTDRDCEGYTACIWCGRPLEEGEDQACVKCRERRDEDDPAAEEPERWDGME